MGERCGGGQPGGGARGWAGGGQVGAAGGDVGGGGGRAGRGVAPWGREGETGAGGAACTTEQGVGAVVDDESVRVGVGGGE